MPGTPVAPVIDTATLQRVGGPLGSNPGGVFQDAAGQRYYVKTLESAAQAHNERLAARLYQLAGVPTLRYVATRAPEQVATVMVALDKRCLAQFSAAERRQAQHWLGVHAWLANWDAAGFAGDNQGVLDGTVLTLDVGGALAFRAQGEPKGRDFGTAVDELDSLRRSADNPHACRLFGDIGPSALRAAISVVTRLPAEQVRRCIAESGGHAALAEKMLARQADLARRLAELDRAAVAGPAA